MRPPLHLIHYWASKITMLKRAIVILIPNQNKVQENTGLSKKCRVHFVQAGFVFLEVGPN